MATKEQTLVAIVSLIKEPFPVMQGL